MTDDSWQTTWDGEPIAPERPHGAAVVVHRRRDGERRFLGLHRALHGPDHEGDWAWTPPAGARLPGESIDDCARRELAEETGLDLPLRRIDGDDDELWALYVAEAPADAEVVLDAEHDRFAWLPLDELLVRCAPDEVVRELRRAAATIIDDHPG